MSYAKKDYSLTGESAAKAMEQGLAFAEWYHSDIPRETMKELMQRRDGPAIRDTIIWIALIGLSAAGGIYFWGSWAGVPFFFVYGVLYGSSSDSRWHECGHRTAFKTAWMNNVIYEVASFMLMRNPARWRLSHARHHADTIIIGRDAEIAVMRPPDLVRIMIMFFGIYDMWISLWTLIKNAFGILSDDEKDFVPENKRAGVIVSARWHIAIYVVTILTVLYMKSWLPVVLIGLPRAYGAWHMILTGLLQHGGLAENVVDHRLNTRTVYMNPISRFLYWNMNYHIEHHMFPMVPYHALPKLHALIKDDLPAPNPSMFHAYREMIPIWIKQLQYEDVYLKRELPASAKPYMSAPVALAAE